MLAVLCGHARDRSRKLPRSGKKDWVVKGVGRHFAVAYRLCFRGWLGGPSFSRFGVFRDVPLRNRGWAGGPAFACVPLWDYKRLGCEPVRRAECRTHTLGFIMGKIKRGDTNGRDAA